MELGLGVAARGVVAGTPRPRSRYGMRPDGTRGPIGVETDDAGNSLVGLPVTLAGGPAGWVESAIVVMPEQLASGLPAEGMLVEFSGTLRAAVRGADYGQTRVTVIGTTGVRVVGSAIDALAALGGASVRDRAAS